MGTVQTALLEAASTLCICSGRTPARAPSFNHHRHEGEAEQAVAWPANPMEEYAAPDQDAIAEAGVSLLPADAGRGVRTAPNIDAQSGIVNLNAA